MQKGPTNPSVENEHWVYPSHQDFWINTPEVNITGKNEVLSTYFSQGKKKEEEKKQLRAEMEQVISKKKKKETFMHSCEESLIWLEHLKVRKNICQKYLSFLPCHHSLNLNFSISLSLHELKLTTLKTVI